MGKHIGIVQRWFSFNGFFSRYNAFVHILVFHIGEKHIIENININYNFPYMYSIILSYTNNSTNKNLKIILLVVNTKYD